MSDENIHALPVGHEFDGYRILRVLGAGGFGITYLAEEIQIGRKVAIKEYLPSGFAARASGSTKVRAISAAAKEKFDWGLDRFRQEAKTLVAFEHPNIVAVHRYFEDNGTAYLVMQYVEGKPLDALLAKGTTLAESEIDEVIGPILDGLEDVHAAQFLHRDIKPANIYIRKDGRPVLLDFGAARQAFGGEIKSITAIVSEGYAPFEQYEIRGDQGPWTDVYALGAVLYRCITGENPPAAPERISARVRGAPDPMAPAKKVGAGQYSARLLEATDRALGVTREERPQSVGELRELLRGAGSTSARSQRNASVSRRDGGAGALGETSRPTMAPPPPPVPVAVGVNPRPKARSKKPALAAAIAAVLAAGAAAYFIFPAGKPSAPGTVGAPRSSPEDIAAQSVAAAAAEEAAGIVDSAKRAIEKGELERGRDELRLARRRIEEGLARRPGHAGLERVLGAVSVAEADLARRTAARVKELTEEAARASQRRNFAEADRLLDQAERLDPAATKPVRDRLAAARKQAEDERTRGDAEKKRQDEERAAREKVRDLHLSLAEYHLGQARQAEQQGRFAEARELTREAGVQLGKAVEAHIADVPPGQDVVFPSPFGIFRLQLEDFERDLAKRIASRVAQLLSDARTALQVNRLEDAAKHLDEAAALEPASADVAALRRDYAAARTRAEDARKRGDEARSKAEEERRRRDEAERRKKEEEARKKPGADKPDAPAAPGGVQLTGRTGTLSRLSAERRAVMRIQLQFGAGGALAATCTTESAEGGQAPCFGQASGGGRWSLNGATLCLSSPVLDLPGNTCYQVSGSGNQLTLAGPGLLAGAMFLR